jgi:hypothetical protein
LPRSRVLPNFACVAALAAFAAGCSSSIFDGVKNGELFSKPINVVTRSDGSDAAVNKNFDLAPRGAVAAEDLVGADGRCSAPFVAGAPPAEAPAGSIAGDLAGAPMPAGASDPGTPQIAGGIALGMSECDAVRRAGTPANVSIGGGETGERQVVLTYLSGPWPGIYTFSSGRLKEIAAGPVQPKSAAKPVAKKKAAAKPRAVRPATVVQ